ncbi:helix-turn-helix domain containing protein [Streptomyces olivoreticuli]|uniref:helix-turn-helix domain-containing protein n=1 Tax=Streptomyces olivoreticuli TaxID=68246 RepID=UPI00265AFD78|nr:helix-turn-helix domain containing protein [Streptomyces olivoreticuli]WKK24113.1 helix-turn-helix domain containing protein [Streptomyces olivoreticuli]
MADGPLGANLVTPARIEEVTPVAATASDPKVAALAAARSLNPHPEKVVDEVFLASPFCDARDLVQVKYEMVRRVRVDKVSVAQAARAFGYCRQAFYEIAAALDAGGPGALVPGRPGPKGPTKLTARVMDRIDGWMESQPNLSARQLAAKVNAEFGFTVHPRSIERALARSREPESTPEEPIARTVRGR